MEPKFTKGPWSFSINDNSNYVKFYFHELGRMDKIKGGDVLRGYCGKDNAHLISSAPDLYEALELADAALRGARMNMQVVENKVVNALAKVRG